MSRENINQEQRKLKIYLHLKFKNPPFDDIIPEQILYSKFVHVYAEKKEKQRS
jgi:hypothetical protein